MTAPLPQSIRDTIDIWAEHGIPPDNAAFAAELLVRVRDELDDAVRIIIEMAMCDDCDARRRNVVRRTADVGAVCPCGHTWEQHECCDRCQVCRGYGRPIFPEAAA